VEALTTALEGQKSHDAALGEGELLETFYGLLSSVVGPSLTRKLLHFLWQPFEEPPDRNGYD
jgi:hypothetical protein